MAHFGLRHARFAPGESVLVRGAAGGIGIMTVQLAARRGASAVAVTTSSAERGDRLRALGAAHVLDRAGEGGKDAPAGYNVIIDIVKPSTHLPPCGVPRGIAPKSQCVLTDEFALEGRS